MHKMPLRQIAFALCCAVMLIIVAPFAQGRENLVDNASFVDGLDSWGRYTFTGSPTLTIDEQGLRIETSPSDRVTVSQWLEGFVPGSTYKLTAMVKSQGPLTGERRTGQGAHCGCSYIRVQFKDAENKQARGHVHTPMYFGSDDWTRVEATIEIPKNVAAIQIEIFVEHAGGTTWVKDVQFVPEGPPVSEDTDREEPVMPAPTQEQQAPRSPANDSKNLVTDGLFRKGMEHWKVYRFTGNADVDFDEHGVRITTHTAQDRLTVYQGVTGFTAGIPHELVARVRTRDITSGRGAYIRLQFKDANNQGTRSHLETASVNKAEEWTEIRADVAIPEGTTNITLELFMEHAQGTVWFADVRLIPSDIPAVKPSSLTARTLPLGAVDLKWQVDALERLPAGSVAYQVYRSFTADVRSNVSPPIAVLNEPRFVDRTVRANRSYYYMVVPVVAEPYQGFASDVVHVELGDVPDGHGPDHFEAVWTDQGAALTWTYPHGARINYLDVYRHVGDEPTDLEAALLSAAYVARINSWQASYTDTNIDETQLDRTWYIVRATDPDRQQVDLFAVPLAGFIRRIPVAHNYEHPYLIVTAREFQELREAAANDIGLRQLISFNVLRAADGAAALWRTPRAIPAKDANGEHANLGNTVRTLGLAYQFEPSREHYAVAAKNILLAYADTYKTYPKTTSYGGRVTFQTLNEATWLIDIAWAYDLIYNYLTPDERHHIEANLLREAADIILGSPRGILNWQVWHNAGLAAAGFAMQDQELIDHVMNGELSVLYHLKEGLYADGLWWEQSIAYHDYTLEAFTWLAMIAQNGGYDVFGMEVGGRTFRSMYDAPIYHAFSDLSHPSIGDSPPSVRLGGFWIYGAAYRQYQDPKFAWVLQQGSLLNTRFPGVFLTQWVKGVNAPAPSIGSTDFAPAGRNDYGSSLFADTGMAVLRGSVEDTQGLGAAMIYKPGGTFAGHQHADNLSLFLTGLGHQWLAGTGRFNYMPGTTDDRHGTYARHTVAKNTLVVDGLSQIPQTNSSGLWNTDGALTSRGQLDAYVPGPTMQLAKASTIEVYPGVSLERTLLVTDTYVLDLYDAVSDKSHTYDWVIHVDGALSHTDEFDSVNRPLGPKDGAQFITIEKERSAVAPLQTRWTKQSAHLDHWLIPTGNEIEVMLGTSLWTIAPGERSVYVARSEGETARFVSLFAPTQSDSTIKEVRWEGTEQTTLLVTHSTGFDRITLPPVGTAGALTMVRTDVGGEVIGLLMMNGIRVGSDDVSLTSSVPTSVSAGIVDGLWVIHHEGPAPTTLAIMGIETEHITEIDHNAGLVQSITDRPSEGNSFRAQQRKTYILADEATAVGVELAVVLGPVQ